MYTKIDREQEEYHEHLQLVLDAIELNIDSYKKGRQSGWLTVSTQLYVLLCDKSRGIPLLLRILPNFNLHPLKHKDLGSKAHKYLMFRPDESSGAGGITLDLFDLGQQRLPLEDWLTQTIAVLGIREGVESKGVPITIEALIKETRNQAAGHFDPTVRGVFRAARGFMYVEGTREAPFFIKALLAISEYLIGEIRKQYDDTYKGDARIESNMLVLRGHTNVSSTFTEPSNLTNRLFIHAIFYIYPPLIAAPRTFFHIEASDKTISLSIEANVKNELIARFVYNGGREVVTRTFHDRLFQEKLCVVLCTLSPVENMQHMQLNLYLDDESSTVEIDHVIDTDLQLAFSAGSTVDGRANSDLRIAQLGVGQGSIDASWRTTFWREANELMSNLVVPA